MTFENITKENDCNCLKNTIVPNQEDIFLRKLRKKELEEKDFQTHWERGIGFDSTECEEICNYKSTLIFNQIKSYLK